MSTLRANARASSVEPDWAALAADIRQWGKALGFQEIGIADTDLDVAEQRLLDWLSAGRHGAMDYMARHGVTRARPGALIPGTLVEVRHSVVTAAREFVSGPASA